MDIGCINYLNCYPFYYSMLEEKPLEDVHVTFDYPENLNVLMEEGGLVLSPVSAAAYASLQEDSVLLPEFCLSSVGYVGSVILAGHVPIEELHGRVVGISEASRTSEVLVKILLERHYRVKPRYFKTPPRPRVQDFDAALIIGNDAMVNQPDPIPYIYDIGDLWMRKTGHPVVFAVFAVKGAALRENERRILEVIRSFRRSLDLLRTKTRLLVQRAGEKYPDIDYDIESYFRLLQFDFSEELKDALCYYFRAAEELGLLPPVPSLRFLDENLGIYEYPAASQGGKNNVFRTAFRRA